MRADQGEEAGAERADRSVVEAIGLYQEFARAAQSGNAATGRLATDSGADRSQGSLDEGDALRILTDVNLHVKAGESLAVVGPSGSGKSTLLGLLAGLDRPTRGRVRLLGEDISDLDEDARARLRKSQVGFVFQSFQLLDGFSALENVMLPLELAAVDAPRERAREWLTRVGLGARLGHSPKQLSGGEQQRVAVARAFALRPKVLFADEPTGNLDQASGRAVVDALFELQSELNSAVLLVTHDPALAARCQRQVRIEDGRLLESSGDHRAAQPGAAS